MASEWDENRGQDGPGLAWHDDTQPEVVADAAYMQADEPPVWDDAWAGEPPRRRRRTGLVAAIVVAVLVVAGGGLWVALKGLGVGGTTDAPTPTPTQAGPETIGKQYLQAWATGDYARMDALVLEEADDVSGVYTRMAQRLGITRTLVVPGVFDPATATLPFTATLTMTGVGEYRYDGTVQLIKASTTGEGAATPGEPSSSPSVTVRTGWRVKFTAQTVHPRLQNGQRLALASAAGGASPARTAVLDRAGRPLASSVDLAANVLGTSPSGGSQGSGLLRALADRLGGSAGRQLVIADATSGQTVEVLKAFPGAPAAQVRTTLDLTYQKAAEKAVAKARPGPHAAVVAIDTRTGGVLAMANKQITGVPTAQNGLYPPGSTFKVITAIAGLEHGLTPSSKVACPNELPVVGKVFRNHEKARSTSLSLTDAFAQSCNTAFVNVARSLPSGALQVTAQRFGFVSAAGSTDLLPISAAVGSVPETPQAVDLAASAIGQGKVQATPLHMASVAAAVASGTWRQPRLLADCPDCASNPVPEAAAMRTLMRAVVTSGTGTGMRGVPGGPVYAKTGTPEWGSADPPATHGWLIGWQGHTAFAVFVENGSTGAAAAVPVAAAFLRGLPAGH